MIMTTEEKTEALEDRKLIVQKMIHATLKKRKELHDDYISLEHELSNIEEDLYNLDKESW